MVQRPSLAHERLAEALGTFLLVFFGTGAVFVAALTGALQGLLQVAMIWGLAIALVVYALSAISGAHINPAITLATCLLRGFPLRKVLPYVLAQVAGAFIASAVLFGLFAGVLAGFEQEKGLVRVAIPGPRGGFLTVYVLSPCLGAIAGGAAYQAMVRPRETAAPAGESVVSSASETESVSCHDLA